MDDLRPPAPEYAPQSESRRGDGGHPAAEQRHREVGDAGQLLEQLPRGGGDRGLVPGGLRAVCEGDDDPLRAAGPHLLDHVEDPHSSR